MFKLLLKGLAQVIIPVAVKQKLEQQMLDLRRCHLPEQLAILPNRCVIGFHKTSGVLGKVLIKPVADPDAAFAEVTGVIRAEKILEVLNWRFIKLVEKLKTIENLPTIDYNDNKTFFDYANTVLLACEFETLDEAWVAAEEYAEMSDLTMAEEMKAAIRYKKKHPWMLSYPMCNEDDFFSVEFNRFEPYFTIMDDGISYNSDHVRSEELVVESHMQALAQQICGYPSRYCRDSFKLMCGFSYMGTNNCPHYLNGECDGYVDAEPQLPELILDEDSNIKSGCSFELLLKSHNIDIKDIEVGIMRLVTYDEITNAAKKHFSA